MNQINNKFRGIIHWGLIMAIALILYPDCRGGSKGTKDKATSTELRTLRIPDTPFMALLPLYVADETGSFEKHGLKVEWIEVPDPGQARNLVATRGADLTLSTFANLLAAEVRQPGTFRLLLPFYESLENPASYLLTTADSEIINTEDMRGRTFGTYSGPSQRAYAEIVLSRLGYSVPDDVNLIQVSSSAQVQSLFGGAFDVLFAVEPYGSIAIARGARVIESGIRPKYITDPFWVGAIAVSPQFLDTNPNNLDDLKAALQDAVNFIEQNDRRARDIMTKRARVDKSIVNEVSLYTWRATTDSDDCIQIQNIVDLLTQRGLLTSHVDISKILIPCESLD